MKHKIKEGIMFRQHLAIFIVLLISFTFFNNVYSQVKNKPTRQSSMEAFSEGRYEEAYRQFSELLVSYPKDPMYRYYSGVSLVKLEKDPEKAIDLLQQAVHGSSVVKSLPDDAIFYLGKAQQMAGKFGDAIKSYEAYTSQAGKKTAKLKNVPALIQECRENKGEVAKNTIMLPEVKESAKADSVIAKASEPSKTDVIKPVEKGSAEKTVLPSDYSGLLDEALTLQHQADSLNSLATRQKQDLAGLPLSAQQQAKLDIAENEGLAASLQKQADQKYARANAIMNPSAGKMNPPAAVRRDTVINKDTATRADAKQQVIDLLASSDQGKMDSRPDTLIKSIPFLSTQVETYQFFEVLPKPVTDPAEKIEIDPEIPSGLIYRIQIGAFRNPVKPSFFKGISPIYGFKAASGVTTYYAGVFRRLADARKALTGVKAKGFKDSFIVPLADGKRVSDDRALILEKEWGKKPFISVSDTRQEDTAADTIPPSLLFRVEAVRTMKPLNDEAVEELRKVAGNRGLDIKSLDDGNFVYLIGKFITFTSAAEYADLLMRNGYRDARVVAWLGKREIPVETAKQLFENP